MTSSSTRAIFALLTSGKTQNYLTYLRPASIHQISKVLLTIPISLTAKSDAQNEISVATSNPTSCVRRYTQTVNHTPPTTTPHLRPHRAQIMSLRIPHCGAVHHACLLAHYHSIIHTRASDRPTDQPSEQHLSAPAPLAPAIRPTISNNNLIAKNHPNPFLHPSHRYLHLLPPFQPHLSILSITKPPLPFAPYAQTTLSTNHPSQTPLPLNPHSSPK